MLYNASVIDIDVHDTYIAKNIYPYIDSSIYIVCIHNEFHVNLVPYIDCTQLVPYIYCTHLV